MTSNFSNNIDIRINKERRFKFIKDLNFDGKIIANNGMTFTTNVLLNVFGGVVLSIDYLLRKGYIEEILPDKKPISSEENTNIEEDIYSKKYNIYEILTLIPNLPIGTNFKSSLDKKNEVSWISSKCGNYLVDANNLVNIQDVFNLKHILEATYTIVKPVEEVKETWIRITDADKLCSAIVRNKKIRIKNDLILGENYDDTIIETIYKELWNGRKVEYLEEN